MSKLGTGVVLIKRYVELTRHPKNILLVPKWSWSLITRKSPLESAVPWLPFAATEFLGNRIDKHTTAFEYGGGGSTLWLAQSVKSLITVEHDPQWHDLIQQHLHRRKLSNVDLRLLPADPLGTDYQYTSEIDPGDFRRYVTSIDELQDESLHLVIVDGRARMSCVRQAMTKIAPGGMLVLDDTYRQRYLPARELLNDWRRIEFVGLRPNTVWPSSTTIWTRP